MRHPIAPLRRRLLSTLLLAVTTTQAAAQSDKRDYSMFASRDGIEFGWRSWHELSDQIVTELKVQNQNGYKVQIRFTPVFTCPDGTERSQSSVLFTIRPNESQAGNWSGLFWYPCQEGRRTPTRITIKELRIERVD